MIALVAESEMSNYRRVVAVHFGMPSGSRVPVLQSISMLRVIIFSSLTVNQRLVMNTRYSFVSCFIELSRPSEWGYVGT